MWMIAAAVALDMILGDPAWFPHPVIFIGKLISLLEKLLYDKKSRFKGFLLAFICVAVVWGICELIVYLAGLVHIESYIVVFFLYTSLATKSLAKAGNEVKNAFYNGIEEARVKLSYIVGRDTKNLDGQAILRGTVETIAENTIDGVLAPFFFMGIGLIFGKPLQFVFIYKTVNTLDSMVGYKNDKYINFGRFSAKLDDVLNFIPARLGSLIMLIAGLILGYDFKNGVKTFFRDRLKHKSPNSAHPESAVAGLLGIRLGGPNNYFGKLVDKPYIGDGEKKLALSDITKANRILYLSAALSAAVFIILEVVI
jgi:adenosylcobinamide-phosphate synthase